VKEEEYSRKVTKLPMQVPTKINPFSLDEIKLILDNAQGQFKNFFAVAFLLVSNHTKLIS
jgi:hypothetical protein